MFCERRYCAKPRKSVREIRRNEVLCLLAIFIYTQTHATTHTFHIKKTINFEGRVRLTTILGSIQPI